MKQGRPQVYRFSHVLVLATLPLVAVAWHARPMDDGQVGGRALPALAWVPVVAPPEFDTPRVFCFAPGTDPAIMAYYDALEQYDPILRYQLGGRWPGTDGDPITLRWSFVPDGLTIDGSVPSELFSSMDAKFGGNRALWISKIQDCFDRWHELTGITYQHITYNGQDWDDGASWGSSGSTTRGDIRIAAKNIDGPSNVLAYDYYPGSGIGGDMVLDSSEAWASPASDYRFLRNVVMHEHGHGIGLAHCCPSNNTKLLEPYLSTSFDGPQHDDSRAGQRLYGDPFEPDNSAADANDLGTLTLGVTVTVGPVPPPDYTNGSVLSIDADGESDWFKFTVTSDATIYVAVTPKGSNYDSSPQNGDGTCQSGNYIDSLSIADLNVQLIGPNGSTVIATAASQPAGGTEVLNYIHLPNGPGTYYLKVYEGNAPTQSQLYHLTAQANVYDPDPPTPNPMTFASPPHPATYYAISMTATTASDLQSPPVYYFFEFVSGGPGGSSEYWTSSPTYTNSGLQANTEYTYRVKARDSAVPVNETAFSAPATTATLIQTPGGTALGTITPYSMEVFATGDLTNLTIGSSGLYFDCTRPGCDSGLNTWVQTTSATAINLQPNSFCAFRVRARNQYGIETGWSMFNASGYTAASVPGTPTVSAVDAHAVQVDVNPNDNPPDTEFAILCTSTIDPTWQGKYADATGQPVVDPVWQTDAQWATLTIGGLLSGTQYCFAVKARNAEWVETDFSSAGCAPTTGTGLAGDLNCDSVVNFGDINPFVLYLSDFAGWQAAYPNCPLTNGDVNGDGIYPSFSDINPFVALLTGH